MKSTRLGVTLAAGAAVVGGALFLRSAIKADAAVVAPDVPLADLLKALPTDLRYEPLKTPDAANGWLVLAKAAAEAPTYLPDKELAAMSRGYRSSASDEDKEAAAKSEPFLESVKRASSMAAFSIQNLEGEAHPQAVFRKLRLQHMVLGRRVMARLDEGDLEGALSDLEASIRLPQIMLEAGPPLDYAVLASSLLARACRDARAAALHPRMTGSGLQRLAAMLPAREQLDSQFRTAIKSDLYWFVRQEVARLKGPGANNEPDNPDVERDYQSGWKQADGVAAQLLEGHSKPYDRRDTVQQAQDVYLELIRNVDRPWDQQVDIPRFARKLVSEWPVSRLLGGDGRTEFERKEFAEKRPALLSSKNPYGRFALWYFLPVSYHSSVAPFRNRVDMDATRIVLALRRYSLENGRLPATLDELQRTALLTQIPRDAFANAEFGYDPKAGKIWSVGPDGIDEGGSGSGALSPTSRDFVWFVRQGT